MAEFKNRDGEGIHALIRDTAAAEEAGSIRRNALFDDHDLAPSSGDNKIEI